MPKLTIEQMDFLRLRGYRVVPATRTDDDAYSVEYPGAREGAYLKHFSQELFIEEDETWIFAMEDFISVTINECFTDLEYALKKFGTYSFDDKGPSEVMDVPSLASRFRKMSKEICAASLCKLASSPKFDGRGLSLASSIVGEMEDWEELFEMPGMEEIYNCELPG